MEDLYRLGGTPALMKFMAAQGLIDDSQLTVTGTPHSISLSLSLSLSLPLYGGSACAHQVAFCRRGLSHDSLLTLTLTADRYC